MPHPQPTVGCPQPFHVLPTLCPGPQPRPYSHSALGSWFWPPHSHPAGTSLMAPPVPHPCPWHLCSPHPQRIASFLSPIPHPHSDVIAILHCVSASPSPLLFGNPPHACFSSCSRLVPCPGSVQFGGSLAWGCPIWEVLCLEGALPRECPVWEWPGLGPVLPYPGGVPWPGGCVAWRVFHLSLQPELGGPCYVCLSYSTSHGWICS